MERRQVKKVRVDNSYTAPRPAENAFAGVLRQLVRNKTALISFIIFIAITLACIMAPLLTQWEFFTIEPSNRFANPSVTHIFGTDSLGRDVFSRLLYGGRTTLRIALLATLLSSVIGCLIGLAAGYFGRWLDFIISPALDVIASIPVILLVIVFESVLGYGRGYFFYAMVIAAIPQFARLTRSCVMSIMGCEYIEASRALGVSHIMIIARHVLHNIVSPLVVRFSSGVAEALLICTIMGYLEIGVRPPAPEWGSIVFNANASVFAAPMLMIIPCAVITICVISLSLFSDGLRDAMDPKSRG